MKITAVDIWTVVVLTIPGRVHSPEYVPETGWDQVPKHIIRIETDAGVYGLGETYRGVTVDEVRQGATLLLGRNPEALILQNIYATRTDGSETTLDRLSAGVAPAYDAFEIAVFDLLGRWRGQPVHAVLGGAVRARVRADYWMGQQTPADSRTSVARALALGFKGIKIKCRLEEPMFERLNAIREVAGVDFKVTVDPNERFYTAEQTIELAHRLETLGNVEVLEDPIPKSDLAGYVRIHQQTSLPVAMHLNDGPSILRGVQAGVMDCVNLGGGLVGFLRNASVAAAAGLRCWHGSGNDLGILDTAYIHAAATAPNCSMASDFVGSWTRADDLITEAIQFSAGYTPTPMAPGLGCELDLDALQRYTQHHERLEPTE